MARDRLAAMRAQQGGGGYNNNQYDNDDSAPSLPQTRYGGGGAAGGGGGGRRANPYAQQDDRRQDDRYQDDNRYEMSNVRDNTSYSNNAQAGGGGGGDMSAFYAEISSVQESLRTFNDNVSRISDLHSRSLNNMDENASQRNASQLDALVADTADLSNDLKKRIKALERQGGSGRDGQVKKQQTGLVKSKFVEAIQNYQQVEQKHRQQHKQRMERQFKIVKPDATPEEVRSVVNDDSGGQIFQQALMNSNRYGESRAAYREVQERHEDIKRIEKTLVELAQLFNDMSTLVEQQDDTINVIQAHAETVEHDTEAGLQATGKAVDSARAARKKRWICFIIIVVILIIVAIVVAVVVVQNMPKGGGSAPAPAPATVTAAPSATGAATRLVRAIDWD